jgi:hypothetical protein
MGMRNSCDKMGRQVLSAQIATVVAAKFHNLSQ